MVEVASRIRPPQGNGGIRTPIVRVPPRGDGPPRYLQGSARPMILQAALEAAGERGYEALRVVDITDRVGITRQAFYVHFRDKRHCLCEALDSRLAAVEQMASAPGSTLVPWTEYVVGAIDESLAERFSATEGTRGRLAAAMRELLAEYEGLGRITIGKLVKQAHVPQGDFYRHFSGKKECFAYVYGQLLEELGEAVRGSIIPAGRLDPATMLQRLGEEMEADGLRTRLLIVEATQLPATKRRGYAGATKGSFAELISDLLGECPAVDPSDSQIYLVAASVAEVLRSSVLATDSAPLSTTLRDLGETFVSPLLVDGRAESPRLVA